MTDNNEKVSVVGEPTLKKEETVDIDAIVDEIGDEIEAEESEETNAPQAETPLPAFDISKLTLEQLQQLQARLSATPSAAETQKHKTYIKLREYMGKVIVDFGNAFIGLMDDPENNRQVHRHFIKVRLDGETEMRTIAYEVFMQLEQINCEVLKTLSSEDPQKVGSTYNEHGELVEMTVVKKNYEFKVLTPDGKELTIDGKVANG